MPITLAPLMNPPLALTPLIAHIPHAVPVVIVWGIMLRFYLVQRRQKPGRAVPMQRAPDVTRADRPAGRKVWAADDTPGTRPAHTHQEAPVVERIPAGRL